MITLNNNGTLAFQNGSLSITDAYYSESLNNNSYAVNYVSSSTTTGAVAGIAGYAEANADQYNYASAVENVAIGQSFRATGNILTQATFYARVNGTPPGNCIAALYGHTGTFGTTGLPSGSILAQSDPVAASSFPATPGGPVTFTFTGANQYTLVSGSVYVIALYYNSGSTTNHLGVEIDISSGTDPGRCYYLSTAGTWFTTTRDAIGTSGPSDDLTFQVSGSSITTTIIRPQLVASYSFSNRDANVSLGTFGSNIKYAQSFQGNGRKLISASVSLAKTGSPVGTLLLRIYDHSGSYGSGALPIGRSLAVSDSFNVANLTTTNTASYINFTGPNAVTLNISQSYFLAVEYNSGSANNVVSLGIDNSSPTAAGNAAFMITGSNTWVTSSADMCFEIYGV